jgi:NAD-dependent DNA ligase
MNIDSRVAVLVSQIVTAKKSYYAGTPHISDTAYDAIEDELRKIDPLHPILYAVGYDDSYDWWLTHYRDALSNTLDSQYTNK